MFKLKLIFIFLFFVLFSGQGTWAQTDCAFTQVRSANFDFDDNIFVTPARIISWDTVNQVEVEVSTGYWALIKNQIGQIGVYKDFVLRPDFLRNFNDAGSFGTDLFKMQVEQALKSKDMSWKGPRWEAFVAAMSCPQTRAQATLITAREHAPQSILKGLQVLKDKGQILAVPDLSHIYPVRWPNFPNSLKGRTDAESKANVMKTLLDQIEAQPIPEDAREVINANGTSQEKLHLWDFSDDDFDNFSKALETLAPEIKGGRWPHIKITLYYTGHVNPSHNQPFSIVIKSDGTSRPASDQ